MLAPDVLHLLLAPHVPILPFELAAEAAGYFLF
jgi:hypothetical protein